MGQKPNGAAIVDSVVAMGKGQGGSKGSVSSAGPLRDSPKAGLSANKYAALVLDGLDLTEQAMDDMGNLGLEVSPSLIISCPIVQQPKGRGRVESFPWERWWGWKEG